MNNEKNLRKFIERYPYATLQDIFKLEYQATLGSGHMAPSLEEVNQILQEEVDNLIYREDLLHEPLTEEIGGGMIRVNLRPYVHKKYPLDALAKMFYDSQKYSENKPEMLLEELDENKENIERLFKNYREEEYQDFINYLKESNFRPFSHSLIYRAHYYPSYRVVYKETFTKFLDSIQKE